MLAARTRLQSSDPLPQKLTPVNWGEGNSTGLFSIREQEFRKIKLYFKSLYLKNLQQTQNLDLVNMIAGHTV